MNAAKTASRRNLLSMLTLTKRIAKAIAKTIERINNTIERFSLSIHNSNLFFVFQILCMNC